MKRSILFVLLFAGFCLPAWNQKMSATEEDDLRRGLSEAGQNPTEMVRALERHLEKYPQSPERKDLELALAKTAIEAKDTRRAVLYGEKVLESGNRDLQILERVTRALLADDSKEKSERALKYAKMMEQGLREFEKNRPQEAGKEARFFAEEYDRTLGRALVFQARATGNLGRKEEAAKLAQQSYDQCPTAESARETAKWLSALGKNEQAVEHYADALIIADPRNTEIDRAKDRLHLGEVYRRDHDSDKGLGDYLLQAYDRTTTLLTERRLKQQKLDPNAQVSNPMEYTISGLGGEKLNLGSLRGKVVILDFWATWCGPCRMQHPLFEQVKEKFKARNDIVFLPINTDEDKSLVEPFLEKNKWSKQIYYEDGLASMLQVNSIPTTMIFDQKGQLVSRMNGFLPERFADQLSDRIGELVK